jgi:hypothetical protein
MGSVRGLRKHPRELSEKRDASSFTAKRDAAAEEEMVTFLQLGLGFSGTTSYPASPTVESSLRLGFGGFWLKRRTRREIWIPMKIGTN